MIVARTLPELKAALGTNIGFVPTMGAFHAGHLALMAKSTRECSQTVVSLFVNPTQFAPTEDLDAYPRREEEDFRLAEKAGVEIMFAPSLETMYPSMDTSVKVDGVSKRWEGAYRPTHFDGVATVVAKLFNMVEPSVAYFGLKDYQQCRVIAKMVSDFAFPIKLSFEETVRELDGLAMSSRNAYLSVENRQLASKLYQTLKGAATRLVAGDEASAVLGNAVTGLIAAGFDVQYFALVDADTLEPVADITRPRRIVSAAKLGSTRLIDNISVP